MSLRNARSKQACFQGENRRPGIADLSAPGGSEPGPGGFGGGFSGPGSGGFGPGGGGAGGSTSISVPQPPYGPTTTYGLYGGGGGGGFGGSGNAGGSASVPNVPGSAPGGSGGRAYADLLGQLQGGSGGGTGVNLPGGGGGGAIELGAFGNISVNGSVLANGGSASSFYAGGGGGGGAGGGILLHGEGVTLSGLLSAIGGNGGSGGSDGRNYPHSVAEWGSGGNGGGGQVVIDPGAGGFSGSLTTSINVSGGAGGGPGAAAGGLGQVAIIGPFLVTNTNDSGLGSLRQAILNANANPGLDTIDFAIPGLGVHTISPASALPTITDPVDINGYSQPGASPIRWPSATTRCC